MKKIIGMFIITTIFIYSIGALNEAVIRDEVKNNKIERLKKKLTVLRKRNIQIENNRIKYNQLMTEYKTLSSQYQNLIDLCKKKHCIDETKELKQNFKKLKKSIETLNDMIETDIASMRSLEKQEKSINGLIRMEKSKAILRKEEVENAIERYE